MKSATSLTPPRTGLSGTQFTILNVLESLIPKDQEKYKSDFPREYTSAGDGVTCLSAMLPSANPNTGIAGGTMSKRVKCLGALQSRFRTDETFEFTLTQHVRDLVRI